MQILFHCNYASIIYLNQIVLIPFISSIIFFLCSASCSVFHRHSQNRGSRISLHHLCLFLHYTFLSLFHDSSAFHYTFLMPYLDCTGSLIVEKLLVSSSYPPQQHYFFHYVCVFLLICCCVFVLICCLCFHSTKRVEEELTPTSNTLSPESKICSVILLPLSFFWLNLEVI
ncbi:unnamed protein product [Vicia faba]|uniref:Uncharacterized protein n=1 Tax=Vicia faba TaxID=3906 RepID=A0AAV0ZSD7_VICFA|nr:unnamed protein product [Vicia faba]